MTCAVCGLDLFRVRLEGLVADTAAEIAELRDRRVLSDDCSALNLMNFELNGLCLALRELDEDRYAQVNFTDPAWIEQHRTDLHHGGQA
jgi:hypothetical protein